MKGLNKDEKRGFRERLICDHDVPAELFYGGCHIEINGRNRVVLCGCRRILKYSPTEVLVRMLRDIVAIRGKRLTCVTYLVGAISVEGLVDSVSFVKENTERK